MLNAACKIVYGCAHVDFFCDRRVIDDGMDMWDRGIFTTANVVSSNFKIFSLGVPQNIAFIS